MKTISKILNSFLPTFRSSSPNPRLSLTDFSHHRLLHALSDSIFLTNIQTIFPYLPLTSSDINTGVHVCVLKAWLQVSLPPISYIFPSHSSPAAHSLLSFSSPLSIHWAANINTTTILTLTTHEFFSASVFSLSLSSQNLEQHFRKSLQRATISSGVTQRQHWFTSITFPLKVSQKITVSQHYNRSTSDLAHFLSSSH